ncbi:mitochondrial 54S ribosomal protein mrpl1 [Perkinsus olseni]|uniref:Mitochondrial 54S ribosomal protein mrpl1 n=1 Tax=Perkinsus olseni TaxID=32597 RepID=A0A7J6LW06_PEROL|nr:mitochondrial 54S ribosomal protein mrpl1 [Perkinsus olseni]KAF4663346.1 mitochondrial 54S ribosomal protein mrpl1 [Perkinsus olseni]
MLGRRRALAVVLGASLDGAALETPKFLGQSVRYKRYRPFVRTPTPSQRALAQENWLKRRRRYGTPGSSKDTTSAGGDAEEIILKNTPYQALRLLRAFYNTDTASRITFDVDIRVDLTRQSVRGVVQLPYGLQTEIRVLALCPDYMASEMLEAGADYAGLSEPLNKIERGWLPFDKVIALPQVIPQVVKLAKILGPKRLMPNARNGTVVQNLKQAVIDAKSGSQLEYRAEGEGHIRVDLGKTNMTNDQILENMRFFVKELLRNRPKEAGDNAAAVRKTGELAKLTTMLPKLMGGISSLSGGGDERARVLDLPYFKAASISCPNVPRIHIETENMMPSSSGYFR